MSDIRFTDGNENSLVCVQSKDHKVKYFKLLYSTFDSFDTYLLTMITLYITIGSIDTLELLDPRRLQSRSITHRIKLLHRGTQHTIERDTIEFLLSRWL